MGITKLTNRQQHVLDNLERVIVGSGPKAGFGRRSTYFLDGFSCEDQIAALQKKEAIRYNDAPNGPIFIRTTTE